MKCFLSFSFFWAICSILLSCKAQSSNYLSVGQFEKELSSNDSLQILDVRTAGEYKTGHINNALLADWNKKEEFKRRISFINKKKPVYVYCLSGGRSAAAANEMRANGFEKVYELTGGINAWKAADKPLQGKSSIKEMSMETFNSSINGAPLVLVDFGATWCPPCRQMEPVLKKLQAALPGKFNLVKVDGGNDTEIMKAYNVIALPVFIVFKNGKQIWRKDGIATEAELAALLQ